MRVRGDNLGKKIYGRSLSLPPFSGRIQADYDDPVLLSSIQDCELLLGKPETELLLESRNRVGALRLPLQNGKNVEVVIKEFRPSGLQKLKYMFLASKALKSWQGASALVERGIETPFPIAYLEKRKRGFLEKSFFLAERIADSREIRYLFRELLEPELSELLVALSRYLSACHKQGFLHRDLSDGNILVKKDEKGEFHFYLIDTNRIRLYSKIGISRGVKNLVRLGVPAPFQYFFLSEYLGGAPPSRFLWLWYRVNKKRYSFYVEFKKKLRLRQLARKLRI